MARIGALIVVGALVAFLDCGGKSTARTGTGGAPAVDAGADAGTVVIPASCGGDGATQLFGGVRYECANGEWTPVTPCMIGGNRDACCFGLGAMSSSDVATDPCRVPFPAVTPDGSDACVPTFDPTACGTCGAPDPFPTRVAELAPNGLCVATSECERSTDCAVAVNHLTCCSCPEAFPKSLLDREPCITPPDVSPPAECVDPIACAGADCASCEPGPQGPDQPPPPERTVRCILNGRGLHVCAFAPDWVDCAAQDVNLPSPPPGGGECTSPASWEWDGTACIEFPGCLCTGTDCAALYATPEACLDHYRWCGAVCVPGMDQTCNDDSLMSSIAGHCESDGTCTCLAGRTFVDASGRCR